MCYRAIVKTMLPASIMKKKNNNKKPVHTIALEQHSFPVIVKRHHKARRMTLRYEPVQQHVVLCLPRYTSVREGLSFVEEKKSWLQSVINMQAPTLHIGDGTILPLLGSPLTIRHLPDNGGIATVLDGVLFIPGKQEFLKRRTRDALLRMVRSDFSIRLREKAAQLQLKLGRISIRDTHSRWGSCSSDGNITLSWRLAFAPAEVIDYVISHEVAHILEMNHSAAFWDVVERLCPEFEPARDWLKRHGHELYRYQL